MRAKTFQNTYAMRCNMGRGQAVARVVIGLAIMGFGFGLNSAWGFAGLIPLLTSVLKYCPVLGLLGVGKCERVDTPPPGSFK